MITEAMSADEEALFQARVRAVLLSKLRMAFPIAAALFASFALVDFTLDPASVSFTWPVRAATVVLYLLATAAARRIPPAFSNKLLYAGVTVGAASVTLLTLWMKNGEILAVGSFMLMVVVVAAMGPSLKAAVIAYVTLAAVVNALALGFSASSFYLFVVNTFVVSGVGAGAIMALVTDRLTRRAFRLELELEVMATRDALTGARNRASFMRVGAEELQRAQRYARPVSLLLLDIDKFKSINDTHGHPAGDAVIKQLAVSAQAALRTIDQVGRLGGEEFAVLLPETDGKGALEAGERVRAAVEAVRVSFEGKVLAFTVSIGVAERRTEEPLDKLLSRADEALYAAKRGGRNRVCEAA